jgi:hypothetical protein
MKLCKLFTLLITLSLAFAACNKVDDPAGESTGSISVGTSGECKPFTAVGIFKVDSVLNTENYVDIEINVTTGGNFEIKTDSVNGYYFKKSGTLTAGINRVRLYASGKPITTGVNYFTVTYGLSKGTFAITVFNTGIGTAFYTLGGSPGNCSVSAINGNYITGQPMTASNTVETTVNVTAIGTYTIRGPVINGVSFDTSGTFTNPGIQNIILRAKGTPVAAGLFNYPTTNITTTCSFPITYTTTITNATFALSGSPNNCTGAVVNGTYTAGTALTAGNTAVVNVNVTSPGTYNISTTTVNGISFFASGTFNITGQIQVTLVGTGTPISAGTNVYKINGGGNMCDISVTTN